MYSHEKFFAAGLYLKQLVELLSIIFNGTSKIKFADINQNKTQS